MEPKLSRIEVNASDNHSSLLSDEINYNRKKFYDTIHKTTYKLIKTIILVGVPTFYVHGFCRLPYSLWSHDILCKPLVLKEPMP